MKISLKKSKKRLVILWFIGSGIAFIVVLLQTILGRFAGAVESVWSWFLPTVIPTLSLMVGVFVAEVLKSGNKDKKIDKFIYNVAFGLSIAYFCIILLTIFAQPFFNQSPIILLKQSNLWIAPLQGLAAASLGAFFVKGE